MADQEGGVPAANPPPNQQQQQQIQQQQNLNQSGQQQKVVHSNWSNFKPEFFQESPMKMQKHICYIQMIGQMHITLLRM